MVRGYYQLIEDCNEVVRLAVAVCKNADYKAFIKAATDPYIHDAIADLQRAKRTLEEILNKQNQANT